MRPVRLGSVSIPPITFAIMVVLVGCFIVSGLAANYAGNVAQFLSYVPVVSEKVRAGEVWRLATYALMHDLTNPMHLLFNGMAIFFFGRSLEERWGAGRYLLFLLLTVVVGGTFVVGAGWLGIGTGSAIGASAFAEGLIVAWGLLYRDAQVRLFFAIPVKGITMVWFAAAMWVLDAVSQSPNSAAAHLGGMLTAVVLVMGVWRPNAVKDWWWRMKAKATKKKQPDLFVVPRPPKRDDDKKWVN